MRRSLRSLPRSGPKPTPSPHSSSSVIRPCRQRKLSPDPRASLPAHRPKCCCAKACAAWRGWRDAEEPRMTAIAQAADDTRLVAGERCEEDAFEAGMRPKRLAEFVGQKQARENL